MSWVQIAKRGIDAEKERKLLRNQQLQRKHDLVRYYGKWGFIISYLENYIEELNIQMKLPIEVIILILKILVDDNDPKRERYYYLPLHGYMISSPFRYYMQRFSPYDNKYLRPNGPMHDLSLHRYTLIIEEDYIALHTISTSTRSRDFKVDLDLGWSSSNILPTKSFRNFLKGINCFEQFQAKLFKMWNITDQAIDEWCPHMYILPDIFDPRPNRKFYKMHQMWGVLYTIRAMIDFPF
jgi:hypothetical protein